MDLIRALWPDTTTTNGAGRLCVAGCDTVELAAQHGTPLYLLDEATLTATAAAFTDALHRHYPAPATIHYASKALLNTAVAQLITRCGLGLDCVSLGELALARHAGVDLASVHLHGNAKPRNELAAALKWGPGRVVVDSLDELEVLGELTQGRHETQAVLLRLNPGIDVHTHAHVQTGQLDSKFGLPIATGMAEAAVRRVLELPGLRLVGLHMHLGSQIAELAPLHQAIHDLFTFAVTMRERFDWTMEEFSPGGGLAVAYRPGDPAPPVARYVQLLAEATLEAARLAAFQPPRLVLEPGRALIARAVIALYRVVATKKIAGVRRFVAVDGGMGDNIRPALYDARYHVACVERPSAGAAELTTVVGRYCESGDVLLRDVDLPAVEPGALLAVPMAGAYTLSMASNYNLVPRPALVLLRDGESYVIQRREAVEDLVARDLPLPTSIHPLMYRDLLPFLQCPTCSCRSLLLVPMVEQDGEVIEGGVACDRCGHVTPVKEGILDALGVAPVPWTPAQLVNYAPIAAWGYERLWRPRALRLLSGERFTLARELRLLRGLMEVRRGGLFVDVACSTGLYARALAIDAPTAVVAAVDHSHAMLMEARRYARRSGRTISFVRASAQALPFVEGAAAGYAMGGSLNEIGDVAGALTEARRVLAADGRVVMMHLVAARTRRGLALQRLLATGGIQFPSATELNGRFAASGLRLLDQWCWRVVAISTMRPAPAA